ncbi:D-aminopeptidase [Aliiroseovarius halocynthiae]|uniref:P1 family peptidase n=1 Tax=Aliiroseovarius halocynthiae TaxID=985055 RepID=A0A545SU96_9RHOB|nr:P1 family peptidase [Aliiroseovarius halocynthiae]TQV68541.1 P1 family peptidase [Aliiroseovarius halocynthiae]SMR70945.1 D-aminopeptidase [Aliiroseovarius halocynthiae]
MKPGSRNLITDVAGLRVGNADDPVIKTGATVLVGDAPFTTGVHVMGGAPGTRETDLLAPDKLVQQVDALVLSGGSAFGLDAASGVADALREEGRGFQVGDQHVPIVSGAILFDLLNGGDKGWAQNPYKGFGRAAYSSASTEFMIGSHGAGFGATTAGLKGGLGSASLVLDNGVTVGALVAVNALGSVTMGDGAAFWAAPWEMDGEFGARGMGQHNPGLEPRPEAQLGENTTIAIIATDADLDQAQCTRLATAAHDGMARAIHPSHTPFDGDLIFAASTGKMTLSDPGFDALRLGHAAATCLARAIARGVHAARPYPGDNLPTWAQKFS